MSQNILDEAYEIIEEGYEQFHPQLADRVDVFLENVRDNSYVVVPSNQWKDTQSRLELLDWLESLGVDNWQGYSRPPNREDYDTEEEYQAAYEKELYGSY